MITGRKVVRGVSLRVKINSTLLQWSIERVCLQAIATGKEGGTNELVAVREGASALSQDGKAGQKES